MLIRERSLWRKLKGTSHAQIVRHHHRSWSCNRRLVHASNSCKATIPCHLHRSDGHDDHHDQFAARSRIRPRHCFPAKRCALLGTDIKAIKFKPRCAPPARRGLKLTKLRFNFITFDIYVFVMVDTAKQDGCGNPSLFHCRRYSSLSSRLSGLRLAPEHRETPPQDSYPNGAYWQTEPGGQMSALISQEK